MVSVCAVRCVRATEVLLYVSPFASECLGKVHGGQWGSTSFNFWNIGFLYFLPGLETKGRKRTSTSKFWYELPCASRKHPDASTFRHRNCAFRSHGEIRIPFPLDPSLK